MDFQNGLDKIPETLHYFIHNGDVAFYADCFDGDPFSDVLVYSDIGEDYDYLKICEHNLRFIHEFQNLMFCLTKEEVNIDFLINQTTKKTPSNYLPGVFILSCISFALSYQ